MSLLYDAGLGLNSIREPRAQLEYLFKIAMDSLGGDRAAFSRYSPYQDVIKFEFGIGYLPEVLSKLQKAEFLATDEGSLSGWVAVHRQPLNLPDLENEPHYKPTDPELKSALMAPVERDEQLLGILTVFSTQPYAFDSADERLLQLFANQAAVAMENAQLLSQTQHQLERIQALHDIDLAITASVSLKVTLKILLEQVLKRLEMDAAGILVYNPHSMELEPTTSLGFQTIGMYPAGNRNVSSRDWVSNRPLRLGESMAGKAALERQLVNIDDIDSHPGLSEREHLFSNHGFSSYFAIPLISKGELKGVMEVLHRTPFVPDKDWIAFLYTLGNQATIAIDNASMFDNLQRSNLELSLAYETTLEGWAKALEMRDMETEGHSQRVTDLTLRLGRAMDINETTLVHVRRGALLHDIGKMGIPDSILLKPAALSEEEWDIMKRHPVYAYELMAPIAYLRPSVDIPYCHHEKWDGSGYPRGLKGEQIPLAARVFAVVDVWDALLSDRPYRPVWQRQEVLEYIRAQSGSHFDPQVVEAFFKLID
jgi:GAF domain-containing protein